jgi:hypothetical protein
MLLVAFSRPHAIRNRIFAAITGCPRGAKGIREPRVCGDNINQIRGVPMCLHIPYLHKDRMDL